MNRDQYFNSWMRFHRGYERRAFTIFRNAILKIVRNIPFNNLNDNYQAQISLNISLDDIWAAYIEVYRAIGQRHGRRVGGAINKELKEFTIDNFLESFNRNLFSWLQGNLGQSIVTVRKTLIEDIVKLIQERIANGMTVTEAAEEVFELVRRRDFYRWQALRIARTEATTAANYGASVAAATSGIVLLKEWMSAEDNRVRPSAGSETPFNHRVMDEVRVDENALFNTPNDRPLRFPGDPLAAGGNRINCRCAVAYIPKRDKFGRVMLKQ